MRRLLLFLAPKIMSNGQVGHVPAQKWVEAADTHEMEVQLRATCFTDPLEHNGEWYWRKPFDAKEDLRAVS